MALTVTKSSVYVVGDRKEVIVDITFDSSYATGGESLTGTDLGLEGTLTYVSGGLAKTSTGATAFSVVYDYTNAKLQALKANGTTNLIEVTSTTDLSTYSVRLLCVGKGSAAL